MRFTVKSEVRTQRVTCYHSFNHTVKIDPSNSSLLVSHAFTVLFQRCCERGVSHSRVGIPYNLQAVLYKAHRTGRLPSSATCDRNRVHRPSRSSCKSFRGCSLSNSSKTLSLLILLQSFAQVSTVFEAREGVKKSNIFRRLTAHRTNPFWLHRSVRFLEITVFLTEVKGIPFILQTLPAVQIIIYFLLA